MSKRQERIAARIEERRIRDRALLDAALAPYLRDQGPTRIDLRESSAAVAEAMPEHGNEIVTITLGGRAAVDVRRAGGRVSVVRSQPCHPMVTGMSPALGARMLSV